MCAPWDARALEVADHLAWTADVHLRPECLLFDGQDDCGAEIDDLSVQFGAAGGEYNNDVVATDITVGFLFRAARSGR